MQMGTSSKSEIFTLNQYFMRTLLRGPGLAHIHTKPLKLRKVLSTRELRNLRGRRGGRCRDRTCDPSRVKGVLYR